MNRRGLFKIERRKQMIDLKIKAQRPAIIKGYENEIYAWKEMISLENKSRITFEFELKGLSSKKNKLTRFFQKSILKL